VALTTEARNAARPSRAADERAEARNRWVLPLAIALVLAPFVVAAVRMATRPGFANSGDQALIGLSVHEATRVHQFLGLYSRFGWFHPGPSWFYLLSPFYKLFGSTDAALVAANIVVQGLLAAAVVAAVHRRRQPALTLAVAGIVALYVARMPARFFIYVWNPFALMLATALFLVLAVRARHGRRTDLLLLVITGSYLVQTHAGTGPLVGAVGACGVLAFALGWRARRRTSALSSDRRDGGQERNERDDARPRGSRRLPSAPCCDQSDRDQGLAHQTERHRSVKCAHVHLVRARIPPVRRHHQYAAHGDDRLRHRMRAAPLMQDKVRHVPQVALVVGRAQLLVHGQYPHGDQDNGQRGRQNDIASV